jgi:hypothetical protein
MGYRYQICTYDVWGNARDGWDVNDVRPGPVVAIDDARSDAQVIRALRAAGIIGRQHTRSFTVDGDETVYVSFDYGYTGRYRGESLAGMPVCELRPIFE